MRSVIGCYPHPPIRGWDQTKSILRRGKLFFSGTGGEGLPDGGVDFVELEVGGAVGVEGDDAARMVAAGGGPDVAIGSVLGAVQHVATGDGAIAHGDVVVLAGVRRLVRDVDRGAHRVRGPDAAVVVLRIEAEDFAAHHGFGEAVGDLFGFRAAANAHLPAAEAFGHVLAGEVFAEIDDAEDACFFGVEETTCNRRSPSSRRSCLWRGFRDSRY